MNTNTEPEAEAWRNCGITAPASVSKCLILLSEKSSGSSIFQSLLVKFAQARCVSSTTHYENETLYWTKAASILKMPQTKAVDSEVPIESEKARSNLIRLLSSNLESYTPPNEDDELIFGGWKLLCERYAPVFLEKSPHHLVQWSSISLILECMERLSQIDFLLIGLIRNPMDTIYSQFKRWKSRPEELQTQWLHAYKNLQRLQGILGERLVLVRYEDMVTSLSCLANIFYFCNADLASAQKDYLHNHSLSRWKKDRVYGFSLSPEVIALAQEFGYKESDMVNERKVFVWPAYRELSRITHKGITVLKDTARRTFFRDLPVESQST